MESGVRRGGPEAGSATEAPRRILIAPFERASAVFGDYLHRHGYSILSMPPRRAGPARLPVHDLLVAPAATLIGAEALLAAAAHGPGVIALYRPSEHELGLRALELGADDIFPSDGSLRELLARVRAVLRRRALAQRGPSRERTLWTCGPYLVDALRRRITLPHGDAVELSAREFELFRTLADQPGIAISREALFDAVMGPESEAFDRAVDGVVSRLRKKLTAGAAPDPIVTHAGVGYAFAAWPDASGLADRFSRDG
jgi:DNA-binding response OmpR family regulator